MNARCDFTDCDEIVDPRKVWCSLEHELLTLMVQDRMSPASIVEAFENDDDFLIYGGRLARTLRAQRIGFEAFLEDLKREYNDEPTAPVQKPDPELPDASLEATATPEVPSLDSTLLEVQESSDQPFQVEPASMKPLSRASVSIAALVAMAKEASEMRTSQRISIKEVTRRLNRRHGTTVDHSKVGKLLKLARLLDTYPALDLTKIKKEDRLMRLLEIPPEHRADTFASGTISTISGTINIYNATRPTWRVMIRSLRSGAGRKKSGAVRSGTIMDLVGDVLGSAWN